MEQPNQFRASFNGFNREDVVRYMEYINSKHAAQVAQLTNELEYLRGKQETLDADRVSQLERDLGTAQTENESLKEQNEALNGKNETLTQQNADILCTYAPKNGSWQIFFQNYGTAGTTPIRLELGELSTNAYRGDRGAAAYAHAMDTTGNPHGITPARIGATTAADVEEMLNAVTPAKIGAATPAYVDSKVAAAKVNVTQATGTSTTAVMSQKAVSDALNAITPAKIGAATPSYVDSKVANAGLGVDVKQTTGTSTTAVMSQKAVSDALAGITAALGVAESALAEV